MVQTIMSNTITAVLKKMVIRSDIIKERLAVSKLETELD